MCFRVWQHIYPIAIFCITLKQLGGFCSRYNFLRYYNFLYFSRKCNISVWKGSNRMTVQSAQWILMSCSFSTKASVATLLIMHPYISSCQWFNRFINCTSIGFKYSRATESYLMFYISLVSSNRISTLWPFPWNRPEKCYWHLIGTASFFAMLTCISLVNSVKM